MEQTRRWMCMAPVSSIKILGGLQGRSYHTVRRECLALQDAEQAAQTEAGRIFQSSGLWVPSSLGVRMEYPEQHPHTRGSNHIHDPLRPELSDHQHPEYFQTKKGILDVYKRLEFSELALSVAPDLFDGPGLHWSIENRKLPLIEWRYLRRSQLILGVGTYEAELLPNHEARMRVSYLWVPRGISQKLLLERYEGRFLELETMSSHETGSRPSSSFLNPDEPHHHLIPMMSGVVIVCADRRTYQFARQVLRPFQPELGDAICWVWGTTREERHYEGTAIPVLANIADRFEDFKVGYPEDVGLDSGVVAKWRSSKGRRRKLPKTVDSAGALNGVLKNRLLRAMGDNPGFSKRDYLTECDYKESGARVEEELQALVEKEYLEAVPFVRASRGKVVFDAGEIKRLQQEAEKEGKKLDMDAMHYWTEKACNYAAGLNRQSAKDLLKTHNSRKNQDHRPRRPHRLHTLIVNEVVSILGGMGYEADNGYRYLVNLPNVTQIPPDAVVIGTYTLGAYEVEQVTRHDTAENMRQVILSTLIEQVEAIREGTNEPLALLYDSRFTQEIIDEQREAVSDRYGVKLDITVERQSMFTVGPVVGEGTVRPLRVLFRTERFFIEVELSAKWTQRIREKFSTYLKLAMETHESCFVIIICGTQGAAERFHEATERMMREAGVRLTVVITTVEGFRTKRLGSTESVLRHRGTPFLLFPDINAAEEFWRT